MKNQYLAAPEFEISAFLEIVIEQDLAHPPLGDM
jgi:hypothetical protein